MEDKKVEMEYRHLGPTGIKVSIISFGNWLNSNSKEAEQNTIDCMKVAWDHGVNFFDTAQVYGFGEAERQFAKGLKALNVPRHQYVLSTKTFFGTSQILPNRRGLSRKHIIEGLRTSLKNLEHDYVDVIFCHRPDPETPMQEICRAYDWVIRHNLAFYWGTSEWAAEEIAQAFMVCDKYRLIKPVVEQPQYNIYTREKMEIQFKRFFEHKQLGTTVWSPLLGGILTGKYNKGMPEDNRFAKNPDIQRIYDRYFTTTKDQTLKKLIQFEQLAKQFGCSMAQLAMAWVINNPDVSTAITGASSTSQLKDTLQALGVRKRFTNEIEKRIEEIFKTAPKGKRNMKTLQAQRSRRLQRLVDK